MYDFILPQKKLKNQLNQHKIALSQEMYVISSQQEDISRQVSSLNNKFEELGSISELKDSINNQKQFLNEFSEKFLQKMEQFQIQNSKSKPTKIDMMNVDNNNINEPNFDFSNNIDYKNDEVVKFINTRKVKGLISKLKSYDLDGETTQFILEEIGMDYQMYKQLNVKYNNK